MPRKGQLELTWIASLKQWRKRYKGKTHYLGTGRGKSDKVSYQQALLKWHELKAETDAGDEEAAAATKRAERIETLKALVFSEMPDPIRKDAARLLYGVKTFRVDVPDYDRQRPTAKTQSVGDLIGLFLADQEKRYEHRKKFPNDPRGNNSISPSRWISIKSTIKPFNALLGSRPFTDNEAAIGTMLLEYRAVQDQLLLAGTIKPNTFNDRLKVMRQFIGWCVRNFHLTRMPRNVADVSSPCGYKPTAKAIEVALIRKLWNAADEHTKCFLSLGLNCGLYARDISTLENNHIQDGYIVRARSKTGVPTRYKLWSTTQSLISRCRNRQGDLVLVDSNGEPLLRYNVATESRKDVISQALRALCRKLKIDYVPFSRFRDTSATHIEQIDPSLTSQFLGHSDKRMAKYYIDHGKLDTSRLDAAIDQLEQIYGLMV